MAENIENSSRKHLTAKQLMQTRGLYAKLSDEYAESSRVLPRMGQRLAMPSGSWLENKQIKTNLEATRDVIKTERVNRLSVLAMAEWVPDEKRAKVLKRLGIDWNNYGHEISSELYLIPEEALVLLEMNYLELTYNGISLSIQQAYELLINNTNTTCTLDEYRVYSQLTRKGYHLQRFYYSKTSAERLEESLHPKKKVIIDPEDGKWMTNNKNRKIINNNSDIQQVVDSMIEIIESNENFDEDKNEKCEESSSDNSRENEFGQSKNINNENNSNNINSNSNNNSNNIKNNNNSNSNKLLENSGRNKRLEIVSEETVVDPVKLIVRPNKNVDTDNDPIKSSNWSSARIQRNVKLLPKRTDKKFPSSLIVKSQSSCDNQTNDKKRKVDITDANKSTKKSKHEIIELSDDEEIEEIPIKMSRMEMLNCFPNVADKDMITQIIPRNYIPQNIKLQNNIYEYDRERLNRIRQSVGRNKNIHDNSDVINNEHQANTSQNSNPLSLDHRSRSAGTVSIYQRPRPAFNTQLGENQLWGTNYPGENFFYNNRQSLRDSPSNAGGNFAMTNFIHHKFMSSSMNTNRQNIVSNRWSSVHVFRNMSMATYGMRTSSVMHNTTNIYQQFMYNSLFPGLPQRPPFIVRPTGYHESHGQHGQLRLPRPANAFIQRRNFSLLDFMQNEFCAVSSFIKLPANSWTELKKKWKDVKTITIEDEDDDDEMDCSEVKFVEQTVQPLVGAKYAGSLTEIYKRLRIIKPAQEKIVRKKKGDYKISYKVYSNTQHYRKATPGPPMFHLVITSEKKSFLQPVELNRLQQDGDGIAVVFAYVSGSAILYMQSGDVSLPNLI